MTKYYCDKCSEEIESTHLSDREKDTEYNVRVQMYGRNMADCFEAFLCGNCFDNMMSFLDKNCKKYDNKIVR